MPVKAASSITITRPSGSPIAVAGLRNASVSYQGEVVGAGAVLSSGVAYASATPGLVGWSVSFESLAEGDSASHTAIRAAQRAQEAVEVELTLDGGYYYYGSAYISGLSRGGNPNSAASFTCTLLGTGAATPASAQRVVFEERDSAQIVTDVDDTVEYDLGSAAGTVLIEYDMKGQADTLTLEYDGVIEVNTGAVAGTGSEVWAYPGGSPTTIDVRVQAPNQPSNWSYLVTFTPDA